MGKTARRVLLGVLVFLLIGEPAAVWASAVENGKAYKVSTDKMDGWPKGPKLSSETALLMDADTGAILYSKGMNKPRYPASITKIMTSLLALEKGQLDAQVTFTEACLADQTPDSSNAGMLVGEVVTLRQCLYMMMLKSANDVATQVAVHIAGSVEAFADLMNQRAQELGCKHTHFVNASGMPDDNQYTTARDMALIFQEAIRNETFREIIGTQTFTLEPTNLNAQSRTFQNHHEMIFPGSQFYYEGCFGGKTGGSNASKSTLVSGAAREGMTLIAVTMRTDIMNAWKDQIKLLDYGFEQFRREELKEGAVTLPRDRTLADLKTEETEKDGETEITYYYGDDHYLGRGIAEAPRETETSPPQESAAAKPRDASAIKSASEKQETENRSLQQIYRKIIFVLAGLILLALIAVLILLIRKKH